MNPNEINTTLFHLIKEGRLSPDVVDPVLLPTWLVSALEAMKLQIQRGASFPLKLRDTWTIASTQFDGKEECELFLKSLVKHEVSPEVSQTVAEGLVLRRLQTKVSEQLTSGKYDTEYLRKLLDIKGDKQKYSFKVQDITATEHDNDKRIIPTNIGPLDACIGGMKAELLYLCARPKQGKSNFFFNLINRQVEHRKVVYVTIADYDRFDVWELLKNVNPDIVKSSNLTIVDFTSFGATIADVNDVFETEKPELMIIDRSEELQPPRKADTKRFELKETALALRRMAKRYHCPVWTDGQLSESGEVAIHRGRRLNYSHLAEDKTGRAAVLDLFMGLQRDRDSVKLSIVGRRPGLPARVEIATDPAGRFLE